MSIEEPKWVKEKAELDALEDGNGPYMEWLLATKEEHIANLEKHNKFIEWAKRYFGQGYSLACYDGRHLSITVMYAWKAWSAREKEIQELKDQIELLKKDKEHG